MYFKIKKPLRPFHLIKDLKETFFWSLRKAKEIGSDGRPFTLEELNLDEGETQTVMASILERHGTEIVEATEEETKKYLLLQVSLGLYRIRQELERLEDNLQQARNL